MPSDRAAVAEPDETPMAAYEIVDALSQLGDRDRAVLALRFGGDLSGPEIAALLGLTLATVQQIRSRSLRKLRAILDEAGCPELRAGAHSR
jgi:RNA polymerase sigma factor (sigma-70 family)